MAAQKAAAGSPEESTKLRAEATLLSKRQVKRRKPRRANRNFAAGRPITPFQGMPGTLNGDRARDGRTPAAPFATRFAFL